MSKEYPLGEIQMAVENYVHDKLIVPPPYKRLLKLIELLSDYYVKVASYKEVDEFLKENGETNFTV